MATMPPKLRAETITDLTESSSIHMEENYTVSSESLFGVYDFDQSGRVLHLPPLPKCVDEVLGFNTASETVHIESRDLSEALFSSGGIKRTHGSDDSTTTSGYESEDEGDEDLQKSDRKKQRKEHTKVVYRKRERVTDTRQRWKRLKNSHSTDTYHHRATKCYLESSQTSPVSSESSSSCSSESDCSSQSDSSDACSTDRSSSSSSESSDDDSMDTDSDSDSLGLSLSASSSSGDSSTDVDDDDTPWKRLTPRVIPCSKSCVCKTGSSSPPTPIARRGGVAKSLYKRLLTRRLLSAYNVSKYDCCDQSCNVYWLYDG